MKNMNDLLSNASKEELEKIAELLAVMQRIADTEQENIIPPDEIGEKAKVVKDQLPEPPKQFLLRGVRSRQEKKLKKSDETVKDFKHKISKQQRKIKRVENKLEKLKTRREKIQSANSMLGGLKNSSGLADFLISKNEKTLLKLEKQAEKYNKSVSNYNENIAKIERKISDEEVKRNEIVQKINRIDEVKDLPNAVVMLYLADKLGVPMDAAAGFDVEKDLNEIEQMGLQDLFYNGEIVAEKSELASAIISKDDYSKFEKTLNELKENGEKIKVFPSKENDKELVIVFDVGLKSRIEEALPKANSAAKPENIKPAVPI